MNEAMLALITKPGDAGSCDELGNHNHQELTEVIKQLSGLGILIAPENANEADRREPNVPLPRLVWSSFLLPSAISVAPTAMPRERLGKDHQQRYLASCPGPFFFNPKFGAAQRTAKSKN